MHTPAAKRHSSLDVADLRRFRPIYCERILNDDIHRSTRRTLQAFAETNNNGGAENDGHEIDGHENAGHVSGVWIGPTALNTVECTVLFQRHLIGPISWYSYRLLDIFVDTLYSCVLVAWLDMFFNYSTSTGGLYNLLRCYDLYSAVVLKRIAHCILHCNVIYFQTIYNLSSNFMSVNFMPGHLVRQFHVRHFQSTHNNDLFS